MQAPQDNEALMQDIESDGLGTLAGDEVRITDPDTGGQKGAKPELLSLIPPRFSRALSRVYAFGAKKYDRDNYLKGFKWSLSFDALKRHVDAVLDGEWLDPESQLPHLAHAAWHCATLIVFHDEGLGTDDRVDFTGANHRVVKAPEPQLVKARHATTGCLRTWRVVEQRCRVRAGERYLSKDKCTVFQENLGGFEWSYPRTIVVPWTGQANL